MANCKELVIEVAVNKDVACEAETLRTAFQARHLLRRHLMDRGVTGTWLLMPDEFIGGKKGRRIAEWAIKDDEIGVQVRHGGADTRWSFTLTAIDGTKLRPAFEKMKGPVTSASVSQAPANPARGCKIKSPIVAGYPDNERAANESIIMAVAEQMGLSHHPIYIGKGLYNIAIDMMPAMAEAITDRFSFRNRNQSAISMAQYGDDMTAGKWFLTHQGLCVCVTDEYARILDGDHRLHTCAANGTPFPTVITFGVEEAAVAAMDIGWKRKLSHAAASMGVDIEGSAPIIRAAVLGANINDKSAGAISVNTRLEFFEKYMEAFEWTHIEFNKYAKTDRVLAIGAVRAAVIRAFYHEDHGQLAAFVHSFCTGNHDGSKRQNVANMLRMRLGSSQMKKNRWAIFSRKYRTMSRGIYTYCDPESRVIHVPRQLTADIGERYPVPLDAPLLLSGAERKRLDLVLVDA